MWIRTFDGNIYETSKEFLDCTAIKKQGDNLIDVLEEKDILVFKDGSQKTVRKLVTSHKNAMKLYIDKVTKVITHEQYMPLAQEIK